MSDYSSTERRFECEWMKESPEVIQLACLVVYQAGSLQQSSMLNRLLGLELVWIEENAPGTRLATYTYQGSAI